MSETKSGAVHRKYHEEVVERLTRQIDAERAAWRGAIEEALGLEPDPENHTIEWARETVLGVREIGNHAGKFAVRDRDTIEELRRRLAVTERDHREAEERADAMLAEAQRLAGVLDARIAEHERAAGTASIVIASLGELLARERETHTEARLRLAAAIEALHERGPS